MLIINGPIRHQLKVNCSSSALGPGWKANATIGRVIRLLLVNIGGAKPGLVDKATQGMPGKYTFCFGENEEESPWEPLHVERGFAHDQSAVSVVDALGTHNIHAGNATPEDLVRLVTACMLDLGSNNFFTGGGEAVLLLCPTHARILAEGGYTKERLQEHFYLHVRAPLEAFTENYKVRIIERKTLIDGKVPLVDRPELMMIVVVGGSGGLHSTFVPTAAWGSVTRAIRNTHT